MRHPGVRELSRATTTPAGLNNEKVGATTAVGCVIIVRGALVVRAMRRGMRRGMHAMHHAAGERHPDPDRNQVSGILVVLICGSKETAVVPITYMVERWSEWEFLYYAIPMGLFTLLCNGAPLHPGSQLNPALSFAHTSDLALVPTLALVPIPTLTSTLNSHALLLRWQAGQGEPGGQGSEQTGEREAARYRE